MASISAADLNESIVLEEDNAPLEDGNSDCLNEDNSDELSADDEKLSVSDDREILSTNFTPKTSSEIQSCVDSANAGDTIVLDGYYLLNRTVNVGKKLNFIGINDATIDGNNSVRLFSVSNSGVTFKNITFKNGYSELKGWTVINGHVVGSGSAIDGVCSVSYCSFVNNYANGRSIGGALYEGNAVNCTFIENYAYEGGAISSGSAVNCTFIDNSAGRGGAVWDCSVVNCIFISNSASEHGGAVSGSAVNCTFMDNSADFGGAITGSAVNCTFINNTANKYGAVSGSAVNCTFIGNSADKGGAMCGNAVNCRFLNNSANEGGAMYDSSAVNCTFIGNSAKNGGGAIEGESYDYNKYNVTNCTFEKNHAKNGGAINLVKAVNCIFNNNYASSNGGAVYNSNVINSIFENNSAGNYGGAIDANNNEILDCKFINNTAKNGGAAYHIVALNCSFTNNNAIENGGSIYDGYAINSTFNENHANNDGGAVYKCVVANSIFENNSADNNGGAVNTEKATNCVFYNNHAGNYGGAVYNAEVSTNSEFQGNTANIGSDVYNVTYFEIKNTFTDLNNLVNTDSNEIYINNNYTFEFGLDYSHKNGILINRNVTVYGNGFTLDGIGVSRIFILNASNIVFKDLIFVNGYAKSDGGAINGACVAENCIFANNSGGAVSRCNAFNCLFTGNSGGGMLRGSAVNCSFVNNSGRAIGGYYRYDESYAENCTFINNPGGAMEFGNAVNCTFIGNSANEGGAIYSGSAVNCTFIRNSASELGGAVESVDAVNCLFINNSNTYSSSQYSDWGGGAMNRGSAKNCTFIGNTAITYGGAVSCNFNIENCTFINNSARYGGAINCWDNVKDCIFINNRGNAIRFDRYSYSVTVSNCTFINNDCGVHVAYRDTKPCVINCTFINNKESGSGNAINCSFINNHGYFDGEAINSTFINNTGTAMRGSAVNCTFINNSGSNGGAMTNAYAVNCLFINNSATGDGGAINYGISVVNCLFINNSAQEGGAVKGSYAGGPPSYGIYLGLIENCTFIGNSAEKGGAVSDAGNVVNCMFINNSAIFGGSLNGAYDLYYYYYNGGYGSNYHYVGTYYTNVSNCTFINGSATYGGAMYDGNAVNCTFDNNLADWGGAIYLNNNMTVTYCNFTNCWANFEGDAIYINQSGNIIYCNFKNCTSGEGTSSLDTNSSSNYTVSDCIFDKYPINIDYHYVTSLIAANLTYFNGEEGILIADLSDIRGVLNNQIVYMLIDGRKYNVTTDSNGFALFNIPDYLTKSGIYDATLSFEGDNILNPSSVNVTVSINKHVAILNADDLILYKNEYGTVIANLSNIRGPLSGKRIIFTINGVTRPLTTNMDGIVDFEVLNYISTKGEYTVGISFEGDDCNNPVSTNISFMYIDYKGILTGSVDGKYYNDTILTFNLVNYRNNKPIFDAPIKLVFSNGVTVNLTTDVDGNVIYRIPFNPDYYDVTAMVIGGYVSVNNVTINEIEIKKIFGVIEHSLLNGNKTIQFKLSGRYNDDVFRNVRLNLIFNNGEMAEIITDDNGIARYDIPFPKGTYSVSVTITGDFKDFDPDPDYISDITVTNDLNCSLNFTNNITFAFGEFGSTNYTVDGGIVELDHIKVINHPEALISLSNGTISVFGLSVGNYVLEVETTPDDYHNPVIGRVNVTVTNAPSKVTFSASIVLDYGSSSSIQVVVEGGTVERKNIKILGHPEANIQLKGQVITVSGLDVGNYILSVTSTPDSDHTASTETVRVTVKKATAVIKASKITVAYKKGGEWTIKFIDSKSGKAIKNMKVTLKVYTGKKFKTVNLKTDSKGEATYQTKKLSKGNHKVKVSATDSRYNFNSYSSSIKVVKQTALKFKVKTKSGTDGASLSITVMNKKTKKRLNGVKIKLKIYNGKKLFKTVVLKSMKKGKYKGVCGYGTNKLSVGKHKVEIVPYNIKYGGSKTVTMKITKKHKKAPAWETKDSGK